MQKYYLFIGYSGKDKQYAEYIYACMSQIAEIQPYLAEIVPNYGENFKKRILDFLDKTNFMVVFLTKRGVQSQRVNQEIGYAMAVKRKRQNLQIIPISLSNVKLRGLITKDSEDILFVDNMPQIRIVMSIIYQIRNSVQNGWNQDKFTWKITCNHCVDKRGGHLKYDCCLPSDAEIKDALAKNDFIVESICPKCKKKNYVNILSLLPVRSGQFKCPVIR
jgi:hypothetical protein